MLSKSRFLAGMQCHLRLWYQYHKPELASEISPVQQAIFQTGHEVGRLATRLYPGGLLIQENHLHHEEAVQSTRAAMKKDPKLQAIFEAAFLHDDVRVRVDILERVRDGRWDLIEVKSSTSVKEVYLLDVAIQYHVLKGSGLDIGRAGILHLNNQYVYDGRQLDLDSLFTFADLKGQVLALQEEILPLLKELKGMLTEKDPPRITPSRLCKSPHECEFWEYCTREMPSFWVLGLSGIRQERLDDLMSMGIQDIRHIPDSFPLSDLQERIKSCVINGEECLLPGLKAELKDVTYPVHFLDFETVSPAIPRYAGTRPYQAMPFQWSNHILSKDGVLTHREYLCEEDKDPREDFAQALLTALGNSGTTFVYSNYEKVIITDLAHHLPKYRSQLLATLVRIKDVQALIKRYYYHPEFHGSFSLKDVIPALVPDMNYGKLMIQQGSQASFEYLRFLDHDTPSEEKRRIKEDLRAYCGHDTMAMLKIRDELLKRF
jgi:hypothetical protein